MRPGRNMRATLEYNLNLKAEREAYDNAIRADELYQSLVNIVRGVERLQKTYCHSKSDERVFKKVLEIINEEIE